MDSNIFDEVLGLEEQFYDEGYRQGLSDGIRAGRIEGRTFGLEKGFEKYIQSGRLHGKSLVWANRVPQPRLGGSLATKPSDSTAKPASSQTHDQQLGGTPQKLPRLSDNARLSKHIRTLHALAESESLSTANTEEAVSDFDDRWKRGQAKAKIIERMVGEAKPDSGGQKMGSGDGSIEDVSVLTARH